ncbi:MAG: M81 family metallopeptidase [Peptococcaceae bacterium]
MKRVLIAEFKHETNTFLPLKTDLQQFAKRSLAFKEEIVNRFSGTRTSIGGFIDAAWKEGVELIPAVAADATPSGKVTEEAYEYLTGALLKVINDSIPQGLDGIALSLHGAMVAEHVDDGEGELLKKIRAAVGAQIPIVCTLDLHANITETMVKNADCLFGYDTNPHVDMYERAQEAFQAIVDIWQGNLSPVMYYCQAGMLAPTINMRTAEGPLVELFQEAAAYEQRPAIRNVSVFGGFPFADVEFAGLSVVVLTNGESSAGLQAAKEIAGKAWQIREQFLKELWQPDTAVKYALGAAEGPIILADVGDNPGGGGSGDTTRLLEEILKSGAPNVGFALIVDDETVAKAFQAGPGAELSVAVGGKTAPEYGGPLECTARVKALTDGMFFNKGPMQTGVKINLGKTAHLQIQGVDLLVTENRAAPNDPEIFRHIGINPAEKKILVIKSRGHFRAAFESLAKEILEVDCPGFASPNLRHFIYQKVRRPIFPLDEI